MHIELNSEQVLYIETFLSEKGLNYIPLQGEILDHICCLVETKMIEGNSFQIASETVFDTFGKDEIKEIQDQTILLLNQKTLTMKKASFLILGLLLTTVTVIWAINIDPPSSNPLGDKYEITSQFGMRLHPIYKKRKMHLGVDFRAPVGTPVYATSDGVIEEIADKKGGYGKYIKLKHDDSFQSIYAQLSEIKVKEGQKIKRGEVIALTGNSGASTGPHLHYEVIKDGKRVNPEEYFRP